MKNGWIKWISIFLAGVAMIGSYMLLVADGRYFAFREGVELTERQKTTAEIQRENLKAIKRLNSHQVDMEKRWLRERYERQRRKVKELEEEKRRLMRRPRAQ